jgi:hypothetical protein
VAGGGTGRTKSVRQSVRCGYESVNVTMKVTYCTIITGWYYNEMGAPSASNQTFLVVGNFW